MIGSSLPEICPISNSLGFSKPLNLASEFSAASTSRLNARHGLFTHSACCFRPSLPTTCLKCGREGVSGPKAPLGHKTPY